MKSIAMLWLALISAISLSAGSPEASGASAVQQVATQSTRSLGVAVESLGAEPALRAARVVVGLPIARTQAPFRHDGSSSPCSPAASHAQWQTRHAHTLRVLGAFSHAVASRGSVVSYFSTAPPLPA